TGTLTVMGLITGKGGLAISGGSGASVDGSLTTTGDVVAAGISLDTHTHPGDSGGTTGTPQ
ncbi:MAG: phage baseplate assembly protein V, partial [Sutterella wadsworthensis]